MKNADSKINSVFVEAAFSVDADFAQIERLGTLIAAQTLDTESDQIAERFQNLGEMAKKLKVSVSESKRTRTP